MLFLGLCWRFQPLEFGHGELTDFDFKRIEADLRQALLPSAQPFALVSDGPPHWPSH